ncbi:ATP-binding protein [Methylobacter sp. S3L5C]|uniref:ATP-binding protein n=1 Tax=Methylobacter sp. S3L5C TaxID=2839024 RepID=UPI001FAE1470|nr:ATP-binding protein [Methylobacter sp. S3L5C]UOA10078.1 response regulator [Methylobacter sp. S3L5C]
MKANIHQHITKIRRDYNALVANETMEDYALRYAPRSFRKWSEFQVANTAFGSTSFLVLEAIGGFLSINYGFTNAFWAIVVVAIVIFITSLPISYYAARYHIDIDLLTRSAGFGYIGSTVTSLIYASFTFTLFALEASIMSLALELYFHIPLAIAYIISAVLVIPLVTFGITTISRMQLWTQPLWLLLLIAPYVAVALREPDAIPILKTYFWFAGSGQGFDWLLFGAAATIAFSMMAQIGEQVDFLRFMPDKTEANKLRWWVAMIAGGPGWIIFGALRQLLGALLAHLAIRHGISPEHAHEPTQMYLVAYNQLFSNPQWALAATTLFIILSQVKINVTNAYAGSLAWSNFFSRLTHSHPGRVVWLLFNVLIALLLMEFGVFGALEKVLGLFSHMAIAWICTIAAELMINKPLGLSPNIVEFKRAYLSDFNPVGIFSTLCASVMSILAYIGLFGEIPKAFSGFIALGLAFILTPIIAWLTKGKHYLTRDRDENNPKSANKCSICENKFEHEDMAYCPAYAGSICSLCCTLDARCLDACKTGFRFDDYLEILAKRCLPAAMDMTSRLRLLRFTLMFLFLSMLTGVFISIIYYQDLMSVQHNFASFHLLLNNFFKIYASLLVFIGLCTWWLILNVESRRVAQEETVKQTQLLLLEIEEHKKTDSKLKESMKMANTANQAKSRFLSNMSHEIRSPLNSIIGYSYILHKDPSIPENRRQAVDTLKRSGEHLSALIEDILDIARIEARKFELNYEPFNFHEFIEHLMRIYKAQAEDKGLSFRCQIINTLPQRVRADERRVGQILINILSNAVKFTQTGEIIFSIGYNGGVAKFEITDTGEGIPEEQLQDIFEPFTRLHNATGTAISGSGLGLTISKILAEIMGGELTVTSKPGQGSTFTVRLFLANLGASPDLYEAENIAGYQGRRQKILVVDDQHDHRDLMVSILEPLGFIMTEADSGEDCLLKVEKIQPDLILLDLAMSGIDGSETTRQLRNKGLLMPIIILSANAYQADRLNAMTAGANDFLAKPVKVPHLLNKLKLHLALNWICQNDNIDLAATSTEEPLLLPPADEIKNLVHFVRIGDLLGLNKHLDELIRKQPKYQPFVSRVKALASEFRIAEIKKLLA